MVDCTDEQFQCSDGNCIPKYLRCNGVPDCTYGDDESDCPTNECPSGEFKCLDNEECIPESRRCDRRVDCRDGSDERNCKHLKLNRKFLFQIFPLYFLMHQISHLFANKFFFCTYILI